MAGIKEFSTADLNTISRINTVSNTIEKINGVSVAAGAAFTGLLDTYTGAAAGYSVRQLKSGVTIAMRVRRDTNLTAGDDDEADVAFDTSLANPAISLDSAISNASVGVTATTLGQFLNVGTVGGTTYTNPDSLTVTASCFVDQWRDQSGNANHADQGTLVSQPKIHSGTVNTNLITQNGTPALEFVTTYTSMESVANIGISGTGDRTNFIVAECDNISGNAESTALSYGGAGAGEAWQNTFEPWIRVGSGYQSFSGTTANTQHLFTSALWSGTNVTDSSVFIDGSAATAGSASSRALNTTNSTLKLGAGSSGAPLFSGTIQEILVWASPQSTNRTGIETNINGYFSIYP